MIPSRSACYRSYTAMKVVSEAGLVMISGSSDSPSLTSMGGEPGPDWQPGFFRTAQNDALVGRAAAIFAFDIPGVTKAATIHDGAPYTQGLTDTFEREFTELGGEIVLKAAVNSSLSRYNSASDVRSPVFSTLVSASATTRSLSSARPAFPYAPLSRRPAP